MRKTAILVCISLFALSCGESKEEVEKQQQEVKQEVEETSNDLFDSLEEDLKEEGE